MDHSAMDHSVHENSPVHDHAMHMMDSSTEIPVVHQDHMMATGGSMDHSAHAGHDMMSMAVG